MNGTVVALPYAEALTGTLSPLLPGSTPVPVLRLSSLDRVSVPAATGVELLATADGVAEAAFEPLEFDE
jgi:hypothetical protein